MTEAVQLFWKRFLNATNRAEATRCADVFHFDNNERDATHLLELVLSGKKRATASAKVVYALEGEPLPRVGDLCVVTDFVQKPRCVIETTAITILPFREMTFDICRREGEDDCLESWVRKHTNFFTQDGAEYGYEFSPELEVVFEDFALVYTEDE